MIPWLLALAVAGAAPNTLEGCDAATAGGNSSPHAYTCYGAIARTHREEEVIEHLKARALEQPHDGRLWLTLGALQLDHGVDCEPALREAIEVLTASGDAQYRVQAHLNLANRLEHIGDVDAAVGQLDLAASVAETTGHRLLTTIAELEHQRAIIRFAAGDIVEAQVRLEALLRHLPDEAPAMIRQRLLVGLRDAAVNLGRPREAVRWSDALAQACRDVKDDYALSSALATAAHDAHELAQSRHVPSADHDYRRALLEVLKVATESGNRFVEATATLRLAEVSLPRDRLELFERCAALAAEVEDEDRRVQCEAGRAIALAQHDPDGARAAADALSEQVGALDVAELSAHAHHAQAEVARARGELDLAWTHWAAMLHTLDERRAGQTSREARRSVHADRIDRFRDVAGALLEQGQIDRALVVLEWMRARDAKEWAASVRLEPSPLPEVTVSSIQAALAPREALVVYLIDEPRSWALVVEPAAVHRIPLAGAAWLLPAAEMSTAMLADPSTSAAPTAHLYDALLAPAVAELGPDIDRLVVVADDALARLPLAALAADGGSALLDRYAVSMAPSIGLWASLRTASVPSGSRGVLALADPAASSGVVAERAALPSLPGARAEAEYVYRLLGGSLRVGDEASEGALEQASAFTVLHIGAHVVIDTEQPESSAVVLAEDDQHDGVTSLAELGGLELDGTLVVLAACQGADGNVLAGEGPLSPARALFVAGARTVVAGLWPVRDDEASDLFQRFYGHLDAGVTVSRALSNAQAELRDRGAPASSWAGFIVIGDGEYRLPTRPGPPPVAWALLAAFVAGGLAYGVHRSFAG